MTAAEILGPSDDDQADDTPPTELADDATAQHEAYLRGYRDAWTHRPRAVRAVYQASYTRGWQQGVKRR